MTDLKKIEDDLIQYFSSKEALSKPHCLSVETDLIEAGFDSMMMIDFLLFVEEKYNLWMPESALTEEVFQNVKTLASSLMTIMEGKSSSLNLPSSC